jgi:hypothetical protein
MIARALPHRSVWMMETPEGLDMRRLIQTITAASILALLATPVIADGKKDCTTEPQAKWKKTEDAEAAARKAGFEVRRSKVEGQCYEVYGVKDGAMHELFYNPVDLNLMLTVKK